MGSVWFRECTEREQEVSFLLHARSLSLPPSLPLARSLSQQKDRNPTRRFEFSLTT
jgi:hypothetical protein